MLRYLVPLAGDQIDHNGAQDSDRSQDRCKDISQPGRFLLHGPASGGNGIDYPGLNHEIDHRETSGKPGDDTDNQPCCR